MNDTYYKLHTMIDLIIEELKEINTRLSILESKK
jgi:hypothetical protein